MIIDLEQVTIASIKYGVSKKRIIYRMNQYKLTAHVAALYEQCSSLAVNIHPKYRHEWNLKRARMLYDEQTMELI